MAKMTARKVCKTAVTVPSYYATVGRPSRPGRRGFSGAQVSWAGLIRYHVLFLIDIATRKVEIAGLTRSPDGLWMDQIARNLLDVEDGFLIEERYLLLDRDPLYTMEFRTALERGGVEVVRLPREARTSTRSPSGLCCRSRASASTGSCR
jgi:hypothetical protein